MSRKLLYLANDAPFFVSHRLPLAIRARESGYEVSMAAPENPAFQIVSDSGIKCIPIPLTRGGTNALKELHTFVSVAKLLLRMRPELVHLVTIKPVLYGGIVSRLFPRMAVVATISGMGALFTEGGGRRRGLRGLVEWLYRLALNRRGTYVTFQNPTDRKTLQEVAKIPPERTTLITGSGVVMEDYPFSEEPATQIPVVLFGARLLFDKGLREFVEAAGRVRANGVEARFLVAGSLDPDNPANVGQDQLREWEEEGAVEFLGYRNDVPDLIRAANLVVLPSYREGLPKFLMEAAACGRAVVTTDVPGCRDAIRPGITGLLVPVRDAPSLADAIGRLLSDPETRIRMGRAGRELAESEFGAEKICRETLAVYERALAAVNS